tara:strand:+ start:1043 stop:2932 length:1890 start_codon:yes stop_codon:yes gene_type:complete
MKLKDKRVFISGGAGVIGRALVPLLENEGAILMVGDLEEVPNDFPSNLFYRQGDLNSINQLEIDAFDPEVFVHLAATFERSVETYNHWEENFQHNIKLSHHLITLLRNCPNLKRVVNASSYLIYDKNLYQFNSAKNLPTKLKESDPINPRNLTGLSKLAHEIELDFISKFKSDKFSSISARIFRGYGTNSRDIISRWIRALLNGEEITVYNDEGFFDYMYAEDTALGLLKLIESDVSGIINLGTGNSRQVRDVIDILTNHFPDIKCNKINKNEPIEASEADTKLLEASLDWVPSSKLEDTIPKIINYEKNKNRSIKKSFGNVLLMSCSAKTSLIKCLKTATKKINKNIKIIGGDISDEVISSYFVDEFWKTPKLDELDIIQFIDDCKQKNISIIIPSRDGELEFFSKHNKTFQKNNIFVMISDEDSIKRCIDKLDFSNSLTKCIIPSSLEISEIDSDKYVVKERYGAGSKSIGINLNYEDAIEHSQKLANPIFQPFIDGKELSVDCYIDKKSKIKGILIRERVLVVDGESQVTKIIYDNALEKQFAEIINSLDLFGHIILQAIIDKEGKINVIECNPRFGGASAISIKSGLDSFYWFYLESFGTNLDSYPFIKSAKELTQIKSNTDMYK